MSNNSINLSSFDKKVIYVYKHLDVISHQGWLKVGETKSKNIKGEGRNLRIEDQNTAAAVAYEVLYTTDAVRNNGTAFSDHDIHELLVAKDIERQESPNPNTNRKSEWFKTDLQTIIDTIEEYKMEAVVDKHDKIIDFRLRDEQREAVEKTKDYYYLSQEDYNHEPSFLWNAKPRFGKTLTAYCFASEIRAQKVLIVTNRPAIADSWYTDFNKFDFNDEGQEDGKFRWIFTCSDAVKKRLGNPAGVYTRAEQNNLLLKQNMVHFISLQDIKGKAKDTNAFKENNKWIFDLEWDLVIIDESHEGVDTHKTMQVFDTANHKFTLNLSGTPFKALASNQFNSHQIYNWSYSDEQAAKENWPIQDGENPYADLPKMNIFTYQLSRILETTAEEARDEGNEYAFDLGEFFRVIKEDGVERFAYEEKVKTFIKNLRNPDYQYPFSLEDEANNLNHTFWLLPGVSSCNLMKKALLEDEYFGSRYASEDIIVAAGSGDEDRITQTALEEVRNRIGKPGSGKHPLETRTITLSCGQLTTGITVPEWTAVLMLNNCKSPSLYMQAAFRAQNPYKVVTSGSECFMKENCYVFDFAPDRILQTLAEMADSGVSETTSTREEKVKVLINFLPVIAEDDEGKMKYLDANEVLTIPLKLITEEVLNRGFMSNRLFENISGIFGCPQDIKDILDKMNSGDDSKSGNKKDKKKVQPRIKIWVDPDNRVHINEDITVATTNGLLGDKKYVEIGSEDGKEVQRIMNETVANARNAGYSTESLKAVEKAIKKKLPKLVSKLPDPEPKPGEPGYHEPEKPDEKPKPNEKTDEEIIRDRLRGFARTIPSFLMAYGSADTKLNNFGDNIPEDTFKELTNITKEEFIKLRDGMDYETKNDKGETVTAHFDGLFNEGVFNSSVQAFVEKRKELACYYQSSSTEDIFEYIPPQSNNQIFTPRRVVKMMVEMLEKENPGIFNSATNTFFDPYMKSGMYITEIVKRIFDETREQYRSDTECIKHILENQVYGFAPSEILDAITKNYIFGFDEAEFISQKNFIKFDAIPSAKDGTLPVVVNRFFGPEGGEMKFTAVIGNPPYQGENHQQIYPDFYLFGRKVSDNMCLIFPTGWQEPKNANNLSKLNNIDVKEDRRIVFIDNRRNVFPKVPGAEWTNIILWKKGYDNKLDGRQRILTNAAEAKIVLLPINKEDIEKPKEINSIVEKVDNLGDAKILSSGSARKPYGFEADPLDNPDKYGLSVVDEASENTARLFGRKKGIGRTYIYIDKSGIPKISKLFDKYKLFVVKAWGNMDEKNYLGGSYSEIVVAQPYDCCSEMYIEFGPFDNINEAENARKYFYTKFFRAVFYKNKTTQNTARDTYKSVPVQDFTENSDIDWSKSVPEIDQQLYKKYGLSQDEIDFVENNIQPMN